MNKKLTAVLAVLLAVIMMIASFAEEIAPVEEEKAIDELVVGSTTMMTGSFFTDLWGNNTSDADVRKLLHGLNLVVWDSATGTYRLNDAVVNGFVATQDEMGNRTYTISLRSELCYSDGSPITAWDYAFSFLLQSAPEMLELGAAIHRPDYIFGMNEYIAGEREGISGIHVPQDHMLSITILAEYLPYFYEIALLSANPYPIGEIAPGCVVKDEGLGVYIANKKDVKDAIFTADLLKETILNPETGYRTFPKVVSGPYKIIAFDASAQKAEFEVNELYCGDLEGTLPEIEKITFVNVANEDMIAKLTDGEIDLVNKAMNADVVEEAMQLVADGEFNASNYARSGLAFVSFNCEQPAMQSAAVRKAIASALDKDALISEHVRNFGIRVDGYYGIGQWMYQQAQNLTGEVTLEDIEKYEFDLDKAAALLEEDGWLLNGDVRTKTMGEEEIALSLEFVYPQGNEMAKNTAKMLKENLSGIGIELKVEALSFDELLKLYYRQTDRDCDMIYMASNFSEIYDPANAFSIEDAPYGRYNRTGIQDEELAKLAAALNSTDPADVQKYVEKWLAFQIRVSEVLPVLPLFSNVYFDFHAEELADYYISSYMSWADAVVHAKIAEAAQEASETESMEEEFVD